MDGGYLEGIVLVALRGYIRRVDTRCVGQSTCLPVCWLKEMCVLLLFGGDRRSLVACDGGIVDFTQL